MDQLRARLGRIQHLVAGGPQAEKQRESSSRGNRLASLTGGTIVTSSSGEFCRSVVHERQLHSGTARRGWLQAVDGNVHPSAAQLLWPERHATGTIPREKIAFVDTETTGLGGTGAVAFLVGIGWRDGEGNWSVTQYLLPDYPDEAALLEQVRDDLASAAALVTYNGASFDIPLLRDRMILHRLDRDFRPGNHLDLLHLSRRVFRLRLRDCSLGNLETKVLGHERHGDIPGYLIPAAYFGWLHSEQSEPLAAVLTHNADDILSLAALFQYLEQAIVTGGETLSAADDIFGLSRYFRRRRQPEREGAALRILHEARPLTEQTPAMQLAYAQSLRQAGELDRAREIWAQLAAQDIPEGLVALRSLAIIAEHQDREYGRALRWADRADELIRHLFGGSDAPVEILRADWKRRRLRLTKKNRGRSPVA